MGGSNLTLKILGLSILTALFPGNTRLTRLTPCDQSLLKTLTSRSHTLLNIFWPHWSPFLSLLFTFLPPLLSPGGCLKGSPASQFPFSLLPLPRWNFNCFHDFKYQWGIDDSPNFLFKSLGLPNVLWIHVFNHMLVISTQELTDILNLTWSKLSL